MQNSAVLLHSGAHTPTSTLVVLKISVVGSRARAVVTLEDGLNCYDQTGEEKLSSFLNITSCFLLFCVEFYDSCNVEIHAVFVRRLYWFCVINPLSIQLLSWTLLIWSNWTSNFSKKPIEFYDKATFTKYIVIILQESTAYCNHCTTFKRKKP